MKRVTSLNELPKRDLKKLFFQALANSFYFRVDRLRPSSGRREESDKSFIEILESSLNERKMSKGQVQYVDMNAISSISYWAFSVSHCDADMVTDFIWINVSEQRGEDIISDFQLNVEETKRQ